MVIKNYLGGFVSGNLKNFSHDESGVVRYPVFELLGTVDKYKSRELPKQK